MLPRVSEPMFPAQGADVVNLGVVPARAELDPLVADLAAIPVFLLEAQRLLGVPDVGRRCTGHGSAGPRGRRVGQWTAGYLAFLDHDFDNGPLRGDSHCMHVAAYNQVAP